MKNPFRPWRVGVVAAIFCASFFCATLYTKPAKEKPAAVAIYQQLQDCTVTVFSPSDGGSYGTGVVFRRANGQVFIWTASHVVGPDLGLTVKLIKLRNYAGRVVGETSIEADIVASDELLDIAVLRPRDQTFFRFGAIFANEIPPALGEDIIHVGSWHGPQGAESVSRGIISFVGRVRDGQIFDQVSATATPGSSGGGVFRSATGEIIGLVNRQANINFNLIIPTRVLLDFARKNNHLEWISIK